MSAKDPSVGAVTVYPKPNKGGTLQEVTGDTTNLTNLVPGGGQSIIVGSNAGNWQAFTKVSYQGSQATLYEGQYYQDTGAMGLTAAVQSLRKAL